MDNGPIAESMPSIKIIFVRFAEVSIMGEFFKAQRYAQCLGIWALVLKWKDKFDWVFYQFFRLKGSFFPLALANLSGLPKLKHEVLFGQFILYQD
jgi:hypothetical protein